jgi:hypothetical protein
MGEQREIAASKTRGSKQVLAKGETLLFKLVFLPAIIPDPYSKGPNPRSVTMVCNRK